MFMVLEGGSKVHGEVLNVPGNSLKVTDKVLVRWGSLRTFLGFFGVKEFIGVLEIALWVLMQVWDILNKVWQGLEEVWDAIGQVYEVLEDVLGVLEVLLWFLSRCARSLGALLEFRRLKEWLRWYYGSLNKFNRSLSRFERFLSVFKRSLRTLSKFRRL